MDASKVTIVQNDRYKTTIYPHYYKKGTPKGSILILHGMAEHHERYDNFASFLNKSGYDVYLYDHRGHGMDKKIEDLGHFSTHYGYKKVICDAIEVLKYIKEVNRGEKLILFGHSMGSLIARNIIQYYDAIDCVIICGTTFPSQITLHAGILASSIIRSIKGPVHRSHFMDHLMFGGKNYSKLSLRTSFDWLTRNNTLVGAYVHDPFCGFLCTISFYKDLLHLAQYAGNPKLMKQTRLNLPIYLVSGSHDPVGDYGKEISKLFSAYQKLNFTNVDCTLYEECRHELLNELNNEEIMQDLLQWIDAIKLNTDKETSKEDAPSLPKSSMVDDHDLINNSLLAMEEESEGERKLSEMRAAKRAKLEAAEIIEK